MRYSFPIVPQGVSEQRDRLQSVHLRQCVQSRPGRQFVHVCRTRQIQRSTRHPVFIPLAGKSLTFYFFPRFFFFFFLHLSRLPLDLIFLKSERYRHVTSVRGGGGLLSVELFVFGRFLVEGKNARDRFLMDR